MFKLVIWDYTGKSSAWCEKMLKPNVAEIVRTLRPDDPDQAEVILRGGWDYVLIFDDADSQKIFDEILETIRAMNFPTDDIIFVRYLDSWAENPAAVYSLLNLSTPATQWMCRRINFINHKNWHRYTAATVEGLHYVGMSRDKLIIERSYTRGENFASDEMKTFHALAKKFYGIDGGGLLP